MALIHASTDGRRRRSERSRGNIVAAMLALVAEGAIRPSADDVAMRAGVGLRSVFRHFNDMESLYAEMATTISRGYESALVPFVAKDWRGRLMEAFGRRVDVYDNLLAFKRAADVHRHESPALETNYQTVQAFLRNRLQAILPDEIKADGLIFETLDMLMSFETWQRLRLDQRLPAESAKRLIERQIDLLLP